MTPPTVLTLYSGMGTQAALREDATGGEAGDDDDPEEGGAKE